MVWCLVKFILGGASPNCCLINQRGNINNYIKSTLTEFQYEMFKKFLIVIIREAQHCSQSGQKGRSDIFVKVTQKEKWLSECLLVAAANLLSG